MSVKETSNTNASQKKKKETGERGVWNPSTLSKQSSHVQCETQTIINGTTGIQEPVNQ